VRFGVARVDLDRAPELGDRFAGPFQLNECAAHIEMRFRVVLADCGGFSELSQTMLHIALRQQSDYYGPLRLFDPPKNQLYVGWEEEGEWTNYTVRVKTAGTYKVTALYGNADNVISLDIDQKPAAKCKLPVATGGPHNWNKAQIGEITFEKSGLHLLTMHYGKGNNLAYLEFAPR
jgi:hypothetical protein